jgi:hypothetical protein
MGGDGWGNGVGGEG